LTQQEALHLLSLPILLNRGWKPGPQTKATLEKYRDEEPTVEFQHKELEPMEAARLMFRTRG